MVVEMLYTCSQNQTEGGKYLQVGYSVLYTNIRKPRKQEKMPYYFKCNWWLYMYLVLLQNHAICLHKNIYIASRAFCT